MTPVGAVSNRTASAQLETAPTKHGGRKCLFIFIIHHSNIKMSTRPNHQTQSAPTTPRVRHLDRHIQAVFVQCSGFVNPLRAVILSLYVSFGQIGAYPISGNLCKDKSNPDMKSRRHKWKNSPSTVDLKVRTEPFPERAPFGEREEELLLQAVRSQTLFVKSGTFVKELEQGIRCVLWHTSRTGINERNRCHPHGGWRRQSQPRR